MRRPILTAAALLALVILSGCCSCRDGIAEHSFPPTVISYSSGGGFTGLTTGYTITADRMVLKWGRYPGETSTVDTLGSIDAERYAILLNAIYSQPLDSIQQMQTGNMTVALVIDKDDVRYTWQWPGVHESDESVPDVVQPLRAAVWNELKSFSSGRAQY